MSIIPVPKCLSRLPGAMRTQAERHPVLAVVGLAATTAAVVFAARKAYAYGTMSRQNTTNIPIEKIVVGNIDSPSPVKGHSINGQVNEVEQLQDAIQYLRSLPPTSGIITDTFSNLESNSATTPVTTVYPSSLQAARDFVQEIRSFCKQIKVDPEIDFAQLRGTELEQAAQLREAVLKVTRLSPGVALMAGMPSGWRHFENVEIIKFGDSELSDLCAEISSLKKLNILDVRNNRLTQLPEELAQLPITCVILAAGNPINETAQIFFSLEIQSQKPSLGPRIVF